MRGYAQGFLYSRYGVFQYAYARVQGQDGTQGVRLFRVSGRFIHRYQVTSRQQSFKSRLSFRATVVRDYNLLYRFFRSTGGGFTLFHVIYASHSLGGYYLQSSVYHLTNLGLSGYRGTYIHQVDLSYSRLLRYRVGICSSVGQVRAHVEVNSIEAFPFSHSFGSVGEVRRYTFVVVRGGSSQRLSQECVVHGYYVCLQVLGGPVLGRVLASLGYLFHQLRRRFRDSFRLTFLFFWSSYHARGRYYVGVVSADVYYFSY